MVEMGSFFGDNLSLFFTLGDVCLIAYGLVDVVGMTQMERAVAQVSVYAGVSLAMIVYAFSMIINCTNYLLNTILVERTDDLIPAIF